MTNRQPRLPGQQNNLFDISFRFLAATLEDRNECQKHVKQVSKKHNVMFFDVLTRRTQYGKRLDHFLKRVDSFRHVFDTRLTLFGRAFDTCLTRNNIV